MHDTQEDTSTVRMNTKQTKSPSFCGGYIINFSLYDGKKNVCYLKMKIVHSVIAVEEEDKVMTDVSV